ncbi:MAG: fimbria/pilus outer membrane usher protein [Azospirillaceae bacterium]|nr:fimbria/pilus outer membrane usher protein [Azospirillaceae bacterium]
MTAAAIGNPGLAGAQDIPRTDPPPAPGAASEDQHLILDVILNGRPLDLVVDAVERGGDILVQPEDIRQFGLREAPSGTAGDTALLVPLSKLPGVSLDIDRQAQVLRITATDSALRPNLVGGGGERGATTSDDGDAYGAVVNYDLLGVTANGETAASGLLDSRIFTPYGILSSGLSAQAGAGDSRVNRLETVFRHSDDADRSGWSVGDLITNGPSWSRPFRMGGFHWGSDFSTRPDLVTFPLPDLSGRAAVPSTLDVFVNNVRQISQAVEPGPFELRDPPIITGVDNIQVVVRDAQGRETVQSQNFYVSPNLLKPGLTDYSLETGWLRQNYGLSGDAYRDWAGVASVRHGLTATLTLEAHAEAAPTVGLAGVGVATTVGGFALITASLSGSQGFGGSMRGGGSQFGVAVEHNDHRFSFSASLTQTIARYADVPSTANDPVPKREIRLGGGLSLGAWGSFHVAYADIRQTLLAVTPSGTLSGNAVSFAGVLPDTAAQVVGDARVLSATYTRQLGPDISFYASANQDFAGTGSFSALLGLTIRLGTAGSGSVSAQSSNHRWGLQAQAGEGATRTGDLGWQAYVTENQISRQMVQANYLTSWADLSGAVDHLADDTGGRLGMRGALVVLPEGMFASRTIDDAFTVVDTHGLADITVLQENRPVGKTDGQGYLLLPSLPSYQANRVAIDPADLPADVDAESLVHIVRPKARMGGTTVFSIARGQNATARLVDEAGADLPVGTAVTLARTGRQFPVGYEGAVFLSDLHEGREELAVRTPTGRCHASLTFAPVPGEIPDLGALVCHADGAQGGAP